MESENDNSLDILGVKPVAKSIEKATDATLVGAGAFLSRICLPAAEQFGLLLADHVSSWRAQNAARIAAIAEEKILERSESVPENLKGNPRVVSQAIDAGSWIDDATVQDFWAGLLASSCDSTGKDDSSIVFVSILSQLSTGEVRLLEYCVEHVKKGVTQTGWVYGGSLRIDFEKLADLLQTDDIHQIDIALDHLRSLLLFEDDSDAAGLDMEMEIAIIRVSSLAINLYVRGHSGGRDPVRYFDGQLERDF